MQSLLHSLVLASVVATTAVPSAVDLLPCSQVKLNITQLAFMRTGSTIMENVLRALLPRSEVFRFHPSLSVKSEAPRWTLPAPSDGRRMIITIRHPLDALISLHMVQQAHAASSTAHNATAPAEHLEKANWPELVQAFLKWGGHVIMQLLAQHGLSSTRMELADVLLLIRYESYSGAHLYDGACIRRIAAFLRCAVDDATVRRIAAQFNVDASIHHLQSTFSSGATFEANIDPSTHLHSGHVSALKGETDYRKLLPPETVSDVLALHHMVAQFARSFWPRYDPFPEAFARVSRLLGRATTTLERAVV